MRPGAAHIAGLVLATSAHWAGTASAQTCDVAEQGLSKMFDSANAWNDRFSGASFLALSDGEKWYWASALLDAQINRLDALLRQIGKMQPEQMQREARAFAVLDVTEACYRQADSRSAAARLAPDAARRSRLRSEIEVFQ